VRIAHPRKVNSYARIMGCDDLILSGGALLTHHPLTIAMDQSPDREHAPGVFAWLRQ